MKTLRRLLSLSLLGLCAAALDGQAPPRLPQVDYVAHEWGTFTSMADPMGIVLEGLHHEEEQLPKFVHDLLEVEEIGTTKLTKMPASYVTQKMETPVIYFYADEPMRAKVDVWFTKGLMTQFFPLPTTVYPRIAAARKQRVDFRKISGSSLHWDIDIIPRSLAPPQEIPAVDPSDPWHFARQTGASYVRTRQHDERVKVEAEHYLFYRGLGRWQPEVTAVAQRQGNIRFENRMKHEIPFCMALQLDENGGRFVLGDPVGSDGAVEFDLSRAEWIADRDRFSRRVGAAVLQALVEQGLYVDEARAMVATWSRSWFQNNGGRVIYLLPGEVVKKVLPLNLEPKPRELVRVLVGRHEFITPEAQDSVEQALRDSVSRNPTVVQRGATTLAGLDRFLEPHLRNVARNGTTPSCRRAAEAMLATMAR